MQRREITIGTRGSKLALFQANLVKAKLQQSFPGLRLRIRVIKTKGDVILDSPLAKIGDKGLFTKEIELALFRGEIDLAVHSMKDLPTQLPEGLMVGAILERDDPRDAFVSDKFARFDELPANATVATSSLRRRAAVRMLRKDVHLVDIRGNIDTRLRKLRENNLDGLILAAAGLIRLGLQGHIREIFQPDRLTPAVAQGALGVEIRSDDDGMREVLKPLHHAPTAAAILAERAFLRGLEGGCQVPIGAFAEVNDGRLRLSGMLASLDGSRALQQQIEGSVEEAEHLGQMLAEKIRSLGGDDILREIAREH